MIGIGLGIGFGSAGPSPTPTITSVSPSIIDVAGGRQTISITGAALNGTTKVELVSGATRIDCGTPTVTGTTLVTVTAPAATQDTTYDVVVTARGKVSDPLSAAILCSDPLGILGATALLAWHRYDVVTLSGSNLSSWDDLSGNNRPCPGAVGNLPAYHASGGQGGHGYVSTNGSSTYAKSASYGQQNTPVTRYAVLKINSAAGGASKYALDGVTANRGALYLKTDGTLAINDGAELIDAAPSGVSGWHAYRALYNGFTGSLLETIDTAHSTSTGSTGSGKPDGTTIGTNGGVSAGCAIDIAETFLVEGAIAAGNLTKLSTYLLKKYGWTA